MGLLYFNPGICLTTEEKARKNLGQVVRRVPVGMLYEDLSVGVSIRFLRTKFLKPTSSH